jgi:hypothetical protein
MYRFDGYDDAQLFGQGRQGAGAYQTERCRKGDTQATESRHEITIDLMLYHYMNTPSAS